MERTVILLIAILVLVPACLDAKGEITRRERAELIRDMMAEHGSAATVIPRSKDPLRITAEGQYEEDEWAKAMEKFGPAARLGDLVEITEVKFKDKMVVFELNHGIKGGRKWWHRVQVGSATRGTTLGQGQQVYAPGGTKIALRFEESIPSLTADEVKEMLRPFIDFSQRTATELYVEQLPPEFQEAIEDKRVLVDMDQDMVLLARGRPDRKYREFKNGVETEDWIYGMPPGNVTFVTFEGGKVVRIRESYAAVGGEVKTEEVAVPK